MFAFACCPPQRHRPFSHAAHGCVTTCLRQLDNKYTTFGKLIKGDEVLKRIAAANIEFVDAVPKSAAGKILRKELRAMEAARAVA